MFALLERLLLLFFVISAVRSALVFLHRMWQGYQGSAPRQRTAAQTETARPAASTTLHQDPVCGTYVATDTSLKRIVEGKVLHFCSPECRDRFPA